MLLVEEQKALHTQANPNPNSPTSPVFRHEGGSYHEPTQAKVIIIDQ